MASASAIRARGIALLQAAMIIPYYRETPRLVALALRTVQEIVSEDSPGAD